MKLPGQIVKRRGGHAFAFACGIISLLHVSSLSASDAFPNRSCSLNLQSAGDALDGTAKKLAFIDSSQPEKNLLLEDAQVKSQGAYGCCWISAMHGHYQRLIRDRFGKEIPLSDDYHVLISIMIRFEEGIHYGREIVQGGWTVTSDWMARNIGLVPEEAWKPLVPLRDSENKIAVKLIDYLNTEIAEYQTQLAVLKKRWGAEEEAWQLAEATKTRVRAFIRKNFGKPPSRFEVDGVTYSPHRFAKTILPPETGIRTLVEYVPEEARIPPGPSKKEKSAVSEALGLFTVYPRLAQKMPKTAAKMDPRRPSRVDADAFRLFNRSHAEHVEAFQVPLTKIHDHIVNALAQNKSVYIATPMVKKFYKKKIGLMAIEANGFKPADVSTAEFSGGHAMLITGVYRDQNGKVLGYRIQNSWGTRAGDLGYFYMARDYFDTYVNRVSIPMQK